MQFTKFPKGFCKISKRYFTKTFRKLNELHLEDNHITYFCMKHRRHLPSLKVINLLGNHVTHVNFVMGMRRYLRLSLVDNAIRCENVKIWSCNPDADIKNRLICDDEVEISTTECVNSTGRFLRYLYFFWGKIRATVVVVVLLLFSYSILTLLPLPLSYLS